MTKETSHSGYSVLYLKNRLEEKNKDPFKMIFYTNQEDIKDFDWLVEQYNKSYDPPVAFAKEIIKESYNACKEFAKSVLKEYPNFPEGSEAELRYHEDPMLLPLNETPNDAAKFYIFCTRKNLDEGTRPMSQKYYGVYENFTNACEERGVWHCVSDFLTNGESLALRDVWEEHCQKPEYVNKL